MNVNAFEMKILLLFIPKSGTASDVAGIVSATIFKNTVNDSNIVTPIIKRIHWKNCKY